MASKLFRKGSASLTSERKGMFVSIADEDSVAIASMVNMADMLSADVHEFWDINPFVTFPCLGEDCPGCKLDNPTRFKAYLPVVTREGEVKIFAFGSRVANQLIDIESAVGEIKGKVLRVKRTGKGLKTQYTVVPTGSSVDVEDYEIPDIEGTFGDLTLEGVTKTMIERGLIEEVSSVEEATEKVAAKELGPKKPKAPKGAKADGWDEI